MKTKLLLFLFLISFSIYSQNSNDDFFDRIRKETQWYAENSDSSKCIPSSLKGWFKEQTLTNNKNNENNITVYFTDKHEDKRGKYIKTYIENNSKKKVLVARIDATIGKIKEYFLIDNNWVQGRVNSTSTCGNSYGNRPLEPGHKVYFLLNTYALTLGKVKVKYKISINISGEEIFSNITEVYIMKDWFECFKKST